MRLADVVETSRQVAETAGRNDKVVLIARSVADADADAPLAAAYLAGAPPQRRLDVGWAAVSSVDAEPAAAPTLTLVEVDRVLTALTETGGAGSRQTRAAALRRLYSRATPAEQDFLTKLILGDLRQGASAGIVIKAVAKASGVGETVIRRAVMLSDDLGRVTELALRGGRAAVEAVGLQVGNGVQPMLASTAGSVTAAIADMGMVMVEWKLDGARIQVHRQGEEVTVFTRNLNDVTARSASTVETVAALDIQTIILDGEVLGIGPDGRPRAFQDTISAFASEPVGGGGAVEGNGPAGPGGAVEDTGSAGGHAGITMTPFFFDVLHRDGEDLLDQPLIERHAALDALVGREHLVPNVLTDDPERGEAMLAEALDRGHEGVMIKAVGSAYAAGRRGKAWRKVKPVKTLDLVVLAVEWGSGRRTGKLSNIHLGARDGDGFVMLGKTFKGMTDAMLDWQTARFLDLETDRSGHVVHVRAEQVVEIAVDGIQTSRRYPGGVALRFARVVRYRDDKTAAEADTLDTVRALGQR